jgi:hypothetical protein
VTRSLWIGTCALAAIGGFFLVLRIAWLAGLDYEWLPYAAHVLGAFAAGAVMMRVAPNRLPVDALAGGALAIILLGAVAFGMPKAFGWVAMRTDVPWLTAAGIAVTSAVTANLGAALARRAAGPSVFDLVALSAMTTACTVMLVARVVYVLGVPTEMFPMIAVACACSFIAAFLTQRVAPAPHVGACSSGILVLLALQLVEIMLKPYARADATIILIAVPWLTALIGARVASRLPQPPPKSPSLPRAVAR